LDGTYFPLVDSPEEEKKIKSILSEFLNSIKKLTGIDEISPEEVRQSASKVFDCITNSDQESGQKNWLKKKFPNNHRTTNNNYKKFSFGIKFLERKKKFKNQNYHNYPIEKK